VAKAVCGIYVMVFIAAVGGALMGRSWSKQSHIISAVLAVFTYLMLFLLVYNIFIIYLRVTNNPMRKLRPG